MKNNSNKSLFFYLYIKYVVLLENKATHIDYRFNYLGKFKNNVFFNLFKQNNAFCKLLGLKKSMILKISKKHIKTFSKNGKLVFK